MNHLLILLQTISGSLITKQSTFLPPVLSCILITHHNSLNFKIFASLFKKKNQFNNFIGVIRQMKICFLYGSFFSSLAYEILCIHTWSNTKKTATCGRNPENITVNQCHSQDQTVSYHLVLHVSSWDPWKTNQFKSRNFKLFLRNLFQMATFPCTLLKQVTSAYFLASLRVLED